MNKIFKIPKNMTKYLKKYFLNKKIFIQSLDINLSQQGQLFLSKKQIINLFSPWEKRHTEGICVIYNLISFDKSYNNFIRLSLKICPRFFGGLISRPGAVLMWYIKIPCVQCSGLDNNNWFGRKLSSFLCQLQIISATVESSFVQGE